MAQRQCTRCNHVTDESNYNINNQGEHSKPCLQCTEYFKRKKDANRREINENARMYYQNNKNKKMTQVNEYKERNRERLKEHIHCGCGGKFKFCNKAKHMRSKKHIAWTESGNIENE